jgi:uncharacterized membrane protein YedE/YeeE
MSEEATMKHWISSMVAGLVFGIGLVVAQMSNPLKVLAFLDVADNWDPSLALVMAAALALFGLGLRLVRGWPKPWFDQRFHWPEATQVDARLLQGAALFGIGWGITGYCPGPAIATVLTGNHEVWLFIPAMLVGGSLERWWRQRR